MQQPPLRGGLLSVQGGAATRTRGKDAVQGGCSNLREGAGLLSVQGGAATRTRGGVAVSWVQQPPPYGGVAVGAVIPAFPSSQVTTVYVIMTTLLTTSGTV